MYGYHAALWLELLSCLGTSILISLLELLCFKVSKAGELLSLLHVLLCQCVLYYVCVNVLQCTCITLHNNYFYIA